MEKTREKLGKFSEMVMQEAYRKKNELIRQAEKEKQENIASAEIQYLRRAYEHIQKAVRKFEKDTNEEVSKAIVESKEAMLNRRDEIINAIFTHARDRLQAFAKGEGYPVYIEKALKAALEEAGDGKISVVVSEDDLDLFKETRAGLKTDFTIEESDEAIIGGFMMMNRDKGFVWDYTFLSRMNSERAAFLGKYAFSIE